MHCNEAVREIPYKIILLKIEHLNLCRELDKIALNKIWSKENWEKELSEPKRIRYGISNKNELLALGCGSLIVDEFHLTAIAVHPDHRKKGLARAILRKLLIEAESKRARLATLEVDKNNLAAINLYKSCGFKTTGHRRNYCRNGNDAFIQSKSLNGQNSEPFD
tara:strand:+ start:64 stop:555 length:492 start_codon:yes stop_codon:yes gene_type:complete